MCGTRNCLSCPRQGRLNARFTRFLALEHLMHTEMVSLVSCQLAHILKLAQYCATTAVEEKKPQARACSSHCNAVRTGVVCAHPMQHRGKHIVPIHVCACIDTGCVLVLRRFVCLEHSGTACRAHACAQRKLLAQAAARCQAHLQGLLKSRTDRWSQIHMSRCTRSLAMERA